MALAVNKPAQLALGLRVDLGPVTRNSPFNLVPEFSYGLGKNSAILAAANLRWRPLGLRNQSRLTPFVYAGVGILAFDTNVGQFDRTSGVIDFGYGLETSLGRWRVFAEHQGIDFFDYNRVIAGLSLLNKQS
jgi:hypothetical protein